MLRNVLFSFAVCCLFCACSTKQEMDLRPADGVIRLGVRDVVESRASVNDMTALAAAGDKIGIFGIPTTESSYVAGAARWGALPVMDNVCTTSVDAATGSLAWKGTFYYPLDAEEHVQFCAYYPFAPLGTDGSDYLTAPVSGQAPVLHFTLTGGEDVMFATPVVGSNASRPDKLSFHHALTQLRFELVDEFGAYTGTTVESITFVGVNAVGSMNIETGTLGVWSGATDLPLAGFEATAITASGADTPQALPGEMMLQPGQGSFKIQVVTSGGSFSDVVVRPTSKIGEQTETTFAAGRSYLITLTFKKRFEIEAGATVEPWEFGGVGEGIVQ